MSDNVYWIPDAKGEYSGLQQMLAAPIDVQARKISFGKIEVTMKNPSVNPVAFFNRLSLVDPATKKRILPVFYDNNYVSVLPGEDKKVMLEFTENKLVSPLVSVEGWNVSERLIEIK